MVENVISLIEQKIIIDGQSCLSVHKVDWYGKHISYAFNILSENPKEDYKKIELIVNNNLEPDFIYTNIVGDKICVSIDSDGYFLDFYLKSLSIEKVKNILELSDKSFIHKQDVDLYAIWLSSKDAKKMGKNENEIKTYIKNISNSQIEVYRYLNILDKMK